MAQQGAYSKIPHTSSILVARGTLLLASSVHTFQNRCVCVFLFVVVGIHFFLLLKDNGKTSREARAKWLDARNATTFLDSWSKTRSAAACCCVCQHHPLLGGQTTKKRSTRVCSQGAAEQQIKTKTKHVKYSYNTGQKTDLGVGVLSLIHI